MVGHYVRDSKRSQKYSTIEDSSFNEHASCRSSMGASRRSFKMVSMKRPTSRSIDEKPAIKPSQFERPIEIKKIVESDIAPPDDEYKKLKELDERFHVLKFSTKVAKKFVVSTKPDGTKTEKHNR